MRAYEYRHIVSFDETNLVGNVYFTSHLHWQGRCREFFLRDQAREVLSAFAEGLCLVTVRCSCEYYRELTVFDEIIVRLRLGGQSQNRLILQFEYWQQTTGNEEIVAHGEQEVACMRREANQLVPAPWPDALTQAVSEYANS